MSNQPHHHFRNSWEEALRTTSYPNALRNVIRIEAQTFVDKVIHADACTAQKLVRSILAGDAYILKNAHTPAEIDALRNRIVSWRATQTQRENERIVEGIPNYYNKNDVEMFGEGYYQVLEHTHGFFRWNSDPLGLFDFVDPYWRAIKVLSGHAPDSFVDHTPKDGTIDKLAVYQYPMTVGKLTKHYDPPQNQKLLLNLLMSQVGRDYGYGQYGFYVMDPNHKDCVFLEHMMNFGDYVCICPTVHHGATAPQPVSGEPDPVPDWNSPRGRWLLTAISVPSHEVKDRQSTVAVNT